MGGVSGSLTEPTGLTAAQQRRRGPVNPDETIPDSSSDWEEKVEAGRKRQERVFVFVFV